MKYFNVMNFISASLLISLLTVSCVQKVDGNQNNGSSYEYTPVDDSDLENMEALQLTKVMGNGINLGNTFEANGAGWNGYNATPDKYETAWGQPVTTKKIFEAYKEAGFDSVRIPVAWTSTMDWRNGDFEINADFMARIKEVVGMALDSGLYVMINDHWDYGWWGLFGSDKTKAYEIFDAIWDQVGTEFKDYDYRLIFEAGNEEWGDRFNDVVDGNQGNLSKDDQFRLLKELSQHFVDKIRNQGSKNEKRFLLIPGFNTDFENTADSRYKMPEDPLNADVRKLLVSVHYYSPSPYAILEEDANWAKVSASWGSTSEVAEQNNLFAMMKGFVDKGYGVIIGEYGVALLKNADGSKSRKQNDTKWMTNILDNCDKYNYCPMLWDCNGYFKKTGTLGFTGEMADVAEVYKNRNYASEIKAGSDE